MSSVFVAPAQVPAQKSYRTTGACTILDATGVAQTAYGSAASASQLVDMGKRVTLANGAILVKVQNVTSTDGAATEANLYKSGYICIQAGSTATPALSPVYRYN